MLQLSEFGVGFLGVFLFLFWREILASSLARAVVTARLPDIWKSWTQGLFPSMISTALGIWTSQSPSSTSPQPQLHPELLPSTVQHHLSMFRHGGARLCLKASSSPFQTGSVRQIKGYFSVQTLPRADSLCRFVGLLQCTN